MTRTLRLARARASKWPLTDVLKYTTPQEVAMAAEAERRQALCTWNTWDLARVAPIAAQVRGTGLARHTSQA